MSYDEGIGSEEEAEELGEKPAPLISSHSFLRGVQVRHGKEKMKRDIPLWILLGGENWGQCL